MNIYLIDLIENNICSDSEIHENENTFTASGAPQRSALDERAEKVRHPSSRAGGLLHLELAKLTAAGAMRSSSCDHRIGTSPLH